jgi:hypothetical protein
MFEVDPPVLVLPPDPKLEPPILSCVGPLEALGTGQPLRMAAWLSVLFAQIFAADLSLALSLLWAPAPRGSRTTVATALMISRWRNMAVPPTAPHDRRQLPAARGDVGPYANRLCPAILNLL